MGAGEGYSYFLGCLAEPRYCCPLQGPWLEQAPMSVPTVCSSTICLLRLLMARLPSRVRWRCPLLSFTWFLPSSCSAVGEPAAVLIAIVTSPYRAHAMYQAQLHLSNLLYLSSYDHTMRQVLLPHFTHGDTEARELRQCVPGETVNKLLECAF